MQYVCNQCGSKRRVFTETSHVECMECEGKCWPKTKREDTGSPDYDSSYFFQVRGYPDNREL